MAVWQDWEMYVRAWNLGWSRAYGTPPPDPPLDGYRAKDVWNREAYFLPYPPWLSEEGKKQARAAAQQQWVQWKAEEDKRKAEEKRAHEEWRADFDRRLKAEEEEKQRKRQAAREASERKLAALAVRLLEKCTAKEKGTPRVAVGRYWPEFLVAPSGHRPELTSWDPANKTYTLPRGVRISSVQEGWEEEMKAYEALVLKRRSRNKTVTHP